MRNVIIALAFTVCAAIPQASSAETPTAAQPRPSPDRMLLKSQFSEKSQLPGLLQRLGVNPISKAQAAECTEEGETCTSNEQCCPGLQCAGRPPATCTTED